MFTGIVEELGQIVSIEHLSDSARIRIQGDVVTTDIGHGDSISVNGVCLTVTDFAATPSGQQEFSTDVMAETLSRTSIGDLSVGSPVNLERALRSDGRFGGHVVQGHIDTTAELLTREPGEKWEVLTFALPAEVARYVVRKGSVTLDGVSLTVSDLQDGDDATPARFSVSLIPTTLEMTTLGQRAPGERVNVEVDVLAKYVERLIGGSRHA
ncbi:MAG: riboflavin synthase [Ornithinimicrobium sp.]